MSILGVNDSQIFFVYPTNNNQKLNEDHNYICCGFADNTKDRAVGKRCMDLVRELLTEKRLYAIIQNLKVQAFVMNLGVIAFGLFGAANFYLSVSQSEIVNNYQDRSISYFNEHSPRWFYKLVPMLSN